MAFLDFFRRSVPPQLGAADILRLTRHTDAVAAHLGPWGNAATGAGGTSDPVFGTTIQPYYPLDDSSLCQLIADPIAGNLCDKIPQALASAGHVVEMPDMATLPDWAGRLRLDEMVSEAHRLARWLRGAGLLVILDHGNGYLSLYGHNQSLLKDAGQIVKAGEAIATVGTSGGQNTPALYFAIRQQGRPSDPAQWCRRQG